MSRRQYAVLFAALAGILVYGREWLVLFGAMPFPEATFFEGYPNLLSPVPGVAFVLGFLLREHPYSAWAAFFFPSLIAHHMIMLFSSGFFAMWPAFLGAHLLLLVGMLAVIAFGAWIGRRYNVVRDQQN
jgi:hypothetical protein